MKYCPNLNCSTLRNTQKQAVYNDDVTFCVSCGSELVPRAGVFEEVQIPDSPAERRIASRIGQVLDPGKARGTSSASPSVSLWGPFAGYGTRGRHVAWLLDDRGDQAQRLFETVNQRFSQRKISGATIKQITLHRKGVTPEDRSYYLLQRMRTTIGLYITNFGDDLYVSQVSYSLGPISKVRMWGFLAALAVQFFYILGWMITAAALDSGGDTGFFAFAFLAFLCCLAPLFLISNLVTLVVLGLGLYRFVTDKDFRAPFRVPPNEFDVDDLISLEKVVEQTVRESLDDVNIDRQLMPVAPEYGLRNRAF